MASTIDEVPVQMLAFTRADNKELCASAGKWIDMEKHSKALAAKFLTSGLESSATAWARLSRSTL
jgi:hypothetical protein